VTAVLVLAGLAILLAFWSYAVYPRWIARLASRAPDPPAPRDGTPPASVEVLVSAADEEASIGARVANLLAQRYDGVLTVAVGCDGCGDGTAAAARASGASGPGRVRVEEFSPRRGKASVVNDLAAASRADLLVFTDANTRFAEDAVARLAARLALPETGAACGRLILEDPEGGTGAELEFWQRETAVKDAEGRLGVCLGANGAIYAIRRELYVPLAPDTTSMDDFLIPAAVARRGLRVVFAPEATAWEETARDAKGEASRRFRIGIGAGQVLRRQLWLFSPRRPLLALAFASRKAARWLAPVAALAAAAAALFSPSTRVAGLLALSLALLLPLSAQARPRPSGPLGRLYYFALMNLSLATGVVAGLFGASRPVWRPTARSR
jgi:cellulose synthase/poly-beta-1,6-N-acetylglucosamine synthase-like glycosyltransferase